MDCKINCKDALKKYLWCVYCLACFFNIVTTCLPHANLDLKQVLKIFKTVPKYNYN